MKFNLEIRKGNGSIRLILPFRCKYPRSMGNVEAVIDTGSPRTIISARDAHRLRLPITSFSESDPIRGFGRGSVPCKKIRKFLLAIRSDNNESLEIKIETNVVDITKLRKYGKEINDHAFKIQTIIGLDFLEENKLKLFVDLTNNTAYLEN